MENREINDYAEEMYAQRMMLQDSLKALENKNQELEKTNYILQEKQFELEQFIYRLQHDFKSPVSTLKGLVNLLELDHSAITVILSKLKDNINKFDTLLASLSYFNVLIQSREVESDIKSIFDETLSKYNSELIQHNISVQTDFAHSVTSIQLNKNDLGAVFGCLISNGIQFYDVNKAQPYIHLHASFEDNKVYLTYSDNGIGMDEDIQNIAFQMFSRGTNRSQGAGLGLYVVAKIVKKYEGSARIKSIPGDGTKLFLVLSKS